MTGLLPSPSALAVFLSACVLLAVVPGPGVLYIVSRSISQGRTAGVISAAGISLGSLVHIGAAALGLAVILASSALAFSVVKFAGAAYLIYLGVRRLMSGDGFEDRQAKPVRRRRLLLDGAVVNVLNPKTALFYYAFLPQFVDPARGRVAPQVVALGLLFLTIAFCSDSVWALLTGTGAHWLRKSRVARTTRQLSGGMLVALGVAAALVRPAGAAVGSA